MQQAKNGAVALITTPEFRRNSAPKLRSFILENLYFLCRNFAVLTTGGTYETIKEIVTGELDDADLAVISTAMDLDRTSAATQLWRDAVLNNIWEFPGGIKGMILVTHELVEQRLDAVIHLTDWADVTAKADSMVLRREANVHNVHIASDISSARYAVREWRTRLLRGKPAFQKRKLPEVLPLTGLSEEHNVLALIAHDRMKLDMCCFVVEHARQLFKQFHFVLATGTTGSWIKKFLTAADIEGVDRVRCCQSGPEGGDVQIAAAVVKRLCSSIIFLQDPFSSHAHETDIRLFEQSVLLFQEAGRNADVRLATNLESARMFLQPDV